jgi:hypothetical protein
MNTTVTLVKRSIVSLRLPKSVPVLIGMTRAIISAMTNNPSFPDPQPSIATVSAALSALEAAETAVHGRTLGAVAERTGKRRALATLLAQLKAYIQMVADGDAETAESVIRSAGVGVRKAVIRQKQVFAARRGVVSGSVKLTTQSVARRASYEWQYSLDAGKTWQTMPVTLQARTTLSGLAPGITATFRSRPVTKAGEGDWSQPVAIIVT